MKKQEKVMVNVIGLIIILIITFSFTKGFAELIQNINSPHIITFYGIITIHFIWKFGEAIKYLIEEIIKKKATQKINKEKNK